MRAPMAFSHCSFDHAAPSVVPSCALRAYIVIVIQKKGGRPEERPPRVTRSRLP